MHNGVLNFALLENNDPMGGSYAIKTALRSGAASGANFVVSTREAIDREEARTGVDYDAAINAATKAYVDAYHTTRATISTNDTVRATVGGATYLAILGKSIASATGAEKDLSLIHI